MIVRGQLWFLFFSLWKRREEEKAEPLPDQQVTGCACGFSFSHINKLG